MEKKITAIGPVAMRRRDSSRKIEGVVGFLAQLSHRRDRVSTTFIFLPSTGIPNEKEPHTHFDEQLICSTAKRNAAYFFSCSFIYLFLPYRKTYHGLSGSCKTSALITKNISRSFMHRVWLFSPSFPCGVTKQESFGINSTARDPLSCAPHEKLATLIGIL